MIIFEMMIVRVKDVSNNLFDIIFNMHSNVCFLQGLIICAIKALANIPYESHSMDDTLI
jgi:hypothetical protein